MNRTQKRKKLKRRHKKLDLTNNDQEARRVPPQLLKIALLCGAQYEYRNYVVVKLFKDDFTECNKHRNKVS